MTPPPLRKFSENSSKMFHASVPKEGGREVVSQWQGHLLSCQGTANNRSSLLYFENSGASLQLNLWASKTSSLKQPLEEGHSERWQKSRTSTDIFLFPGFLGGKNQDKNHLCHQSRWKRGITTFKYARASNYCSITKAEDVSQVIIENDDIDITMLEREVLALGVQECRLWSSWSANSF